MASKSVTSGTESSASGATGISMDELADARDLIDEAMAVQELISRTRHDNEEDFEMVRLASYAALKLLQESRGLLDDRR